MHCDPTEFPRPAKGRRVGFLKVSAVLVAVALAIVRFWPELERNIQGWIYVSIVQIGLALVLFWFAFLSRIRWSIRLPVLIAIALAAFGISKSVRKVGTISSIGFPKLAWKWTQPQRPALAPEAGAKIAPAPAADIPDVPQFFGPNRDGIITGARLARDWNAAPPKELWRQPIGAGWSAFAVVGGRAFTQEQRGENEAVTCYDVLTGKLIWTHTNAAHFAEWKSGEGPRATPAVFRGHVFAYGATGILDCLDAATGQRVWTRDVLKENNLENLEWGVSASPLVFDEMVVVSGGNKHEPTLLAFVRSTGEPLWRSGSDRPGYSSPVLATFAGRRVIVSFNSASLTAHDPLTTEVVLNFPWSEARVPKAAQPVVLPGDRVFLSAGYGTGCVLLQIAAGEKGALTATPVWKNLRMKNQFNSIAVRDGYFYGLDDGGLACVSVETGERKWKGGHYGSGQTLLVDDLVLIQSESGPVALAEAKPDGFRELGTLPALSGKTWNHPTLAGRYLLLRNDVEAVCYELPVQP